MSFVTRRLALFGLVLGLTGCVTTTPQPVVSNPGQYRSVIAMAALPNSVPVTYIGLTVFNNTREIARVDWGLSDVALRQLTVQLGRRYDVTPLPVDPMALTGLNTGGGSYTAMPDAVRRVVGDRSADLVVLVDAVSDLDPGDKTDKWPRFGPYIGRKAFGYDAGRHVGYIADIFVFDGRSFALLAKTRIFDRRDYPFPVEGQPYAAFTPEMKDYAKASVTEMLSAGIKTGLGRLGLTTAD